MFHAPRQKAFSMIEMLLSISFVVVIAGIGIPAYRSFQARSDLDLAATTAAAAIRRAQTLSHAVDGDTSWGVAFFTGSFVLFKGLTNGSPFANRDPNFDEVYSVPQSITIGGLQEAVFLKFSGEPQSVGPITLTTIANETHTISINPKGMVAY